MSGLIQLATTPVFYVTPYQLLWCVLNPVIVLLLIRAFGLAPPPHIAVTSAVVTGVAVLFWNWTIAFNGSTHSLNIDAPVVFFPISWADFFDGITVVALNALVLGLGVAGREPAKVVARITALAGLIVLLTDTFVF
jgi:hypothetical protein